MSHAGLTGLVNGCSCMQRWCVTPFTTISSTNIAYCKMKTAARGVKPESPAELSTQCQGLNCLTHPDQTLHNKVLSPRLHLLHMMHQL
jgi:hypothetical protein